MSYFEFKVLSLVLSIGMNDIRYDGPASTKMLPRIQGFRIPLMTVRFVEDKATMGSGLLHSLVKTWNKNLASGDRSWDLNAGMLVPSGWPDSNSLRIASHDSGGEYITIRATRFTDVFCHCFWMGSCACKVARVVLKCIMPKRW